MEERTFDELIELVRSDESWKLPEGLEGLKDSMLSSIHWQLLTQ
ncbi:hypothetical protein [Oxobacter pfennigii]|nr:hypothetical protein [Oxobacter pfennigii]